MAKYDVVSVFEVTDFRTGKMWREFAHGAGQLPISELRKQYPRFTKFVLEGFELNGTFVHLKLRR